VVDKKVNTADVIVSGLTEGAYYWVVQSFDRDENESLESEKNRFTIIPRGKNTAGINLELEPLVQHGHVLELTGKTEVGARVMVNGQEVPVIGNDGIFHYFTPPLSAGESVITITAQNAKGGVNTVQRTVVFKEADWELTSRGAGTLVCGLNRESHIELKTRPQKTDTSTGSARINLRETAHVCHRMDSTAAV